MIKNTNTIGSLEAALAMASYGLYKALCENDEKSANKKLGLVQQIGAQIKNVNKLIGEQDAQKNG